MEQNRTLTIQVSSVTRKEYMQAGVELVRRMLGPLLGLVVLFTLVIALFIGDFSPRSLIPPFVIALACMLLYPLVLRFSWRRFPADTTFSYVIDGEGWQLSIGEQTAQIPWEKTHRLAVRSHVVLLYHESTHSSMLPRRCLTPEELAWLKECFRASRAAFKQGQKEEEAEFRAKEHARRVEARAGRRQGRWFR